MSRRISIHNFFCCIILLLFLSCSSKESATLNTQNPPDTATSSVPATAQVKTSAEHMEYSLEITPLNATRSATLSLIAKGFHIQDANIEWFVNGRLSMNNNNLPDQFKAGEIKKGDTVHAKAIIQGKQILSNAIQIKNSPPEITSMKIVPENLKAVNTLSVEVKGTDNDGDDISYAYEWTRNGNPAGKDKQIEGPFKRGDSITVKVTPFDGEDYGNTAVLKNEIQNMPPVITEDDKVIFNGNVFSYQVKASDPDGDTLMYFLKTAPPGMTINPSTGLIRWNVPQDFVGKVPVNVVVSDGHGGDVEYNFKAIIRLEK